MNGNRKKYFAIYFIAVFLVGIISKPIISFAWGDSTYLETGVEGSHRTFYTQTDIDNGLLGDKITFNSITDDKSVGNERNFVSALSTDADIHDCWKGNDITVTDGGKYYVRLYVHNNSPYGVAGMATGTKVAISGIGQSTTNKDGKQEVEVNGFIYSDNATPKQYWDYVRFNSDTPFHLEYMYGSAVLFNNDIGSGENGCPLPDDIVTKSHSENGTLIGFDALDGNVPGCYEYSNYITICVKAVYDYDVTLQTQVRKVGEKEWSDSVNAGIGDQVEFQIEYNNTGTETQTNVMIRDVLPGNLKYVANTTKLYNMSYPNWATLSPDGDIVTRGVNIGSYLGSEDGQNGGNAFIRFTAEVVDTDLEDGRNMLVNWGRLSVGSTIQEKYAVVIVYKIRCLILRIITCSIIALLCVVGIIVLSRVFLTNPEETSK